jgi:Reverse transcriptase (RNA-dependent DNA polymerase)
LQFLSFQQWVYTEKHDGTQRSISVAQGFSKVTGKYFSNSHAPVVTDLAFCLGVIISILMKLCTGQFDIETEFKFSELGEVIYMRVA